MRTPRTFAATCAALLCLVPAGAFAEDLTTPPAPGHLVYPYKDLPGVTAPQPAQNDKFRCWTTTGHTWQGGYILDDELPDLVYVCDQNGVISESTRPPNRPYWQYNDPNR